MQLAPTGVTDTATLTSIMCEYECSCATGIAIHLEELDAKLGGQQRDVVDDGQPHAPVLVCRQIPNRWQQALCQQVDANHCIHLHCTRRLRVKVDRQEAQDCHLSAC
jgi:hypothetical protein